MRILLLCTNYRAIGGVPELVEHLGANFIAAGHEAAVLSVVDPLLPDLQRTPRDDVPWFTAEIPPHKPVSWRHLERLVRPARGSAEFQAKLRRWRPHIVNSHAVWCRLETIVHACRAIGVPFIQSNNGMLPREPDEISLDAMRGASAVTVVSQADKHYFEKLSPAMRGANIICNGVDTEAAAAATPLRRERPYIFCAARLSLFRKAIDLLIEAFALVAPRYPELDLIIAGDGPDREQVETTILQAGMGKRVELLGAWPHEKLWALYKGAKLFAMPSRFPEGVPLVFLEAMACGTPVIGTRSGGTPEVVPDGSVGILLERNEPEQWAAAMCSLLDNSELRKQMGERGRAVAEEFSWPKVAQRYVAVYRAVLDARRRWSFFSKSPRTSAESLCLDSPSAERSAAC
jgi:glycosyltransferase involved in cell wall biosynthesis